MPEPYWPKKKGSYRLSDAEKHARQARLWCHYCKHQRYFVLSELRIVFGDIEVDDVIFSRDWRCIRCNKTDTLNLKLEEPPANREGVVIRRLKRIEVVRRPVWTDEFG